MVLSRTALNFGITNGTLITGPQSVRVSFVGAGASPCWRASSSNGKFAVTPASGTGAANITVSIVPQVFPGGGSDFSVVTISECTPNTILNPGQQFTATYRIATVGALPLGAVDTPADGATVSGSVGVTGWVVDDVEATAVRIYRMGIAGDAPDALGRVYIGDAVRVDDARPDVEAAFTTSPMNYRAGWGYLLLTNFLPNGGNGTFVLRAYAADREGHEALIGSRTIVARQFDRHQAVWRDRHAGPGRNDFRRDLQQLRVGSRARSVDGVAGIRRQCQRHHRWSRGRVAGRLDESRGPRCAVPGSHLPRASRNALGVYTFDTRAYADGIHTISWGVSTNDQQVDGIGSRYFNIDNEVAGALTVGEVGSGVSVTRVRTSAGAASKSLRSTWRLASGPGLATHPVSR